MPPKYRPREVAEMLSLPTSTLRYWEKEFPELAPNRAKNHRRYSPADVEVLRQIKRLLYDEGLKIEAAKKILPTILSNPTTDQSLPDVLKLAREVLSTPTLSQRNKSRMNIIIAYLSQKL